MDRQEALENFQLDLDKQMRACERSGRLMIARDLTSLAGFWLWVANRNHP